MEELIRQAFQHVDVIGQHVQDGHYDLKGPNGEIILPKVWEQVIEPDWTISMHMWPMPEKKEEEIPPPPPIDDLILNLDDILRAEKKGKDKGKGTNYQYPFLWRLGYQSPVRSLLHLMPWSRPFLGTVTLIVFANKQVSPNPLPRSRIIPACLAPG